MSNNMAIRPEELNGLTLKVGTGCGNFYVTVNYDDNGNILEVFGQLGKTGGCASAQTQALCRLISTCLRAGIEPEEIIHQLQGIRCPQPGGRIGNWIWSCPDAISKVLLRVLHKLKKDVNMSMIENGNDIWAQPLPELEHKVKELEEGVESKSSHVIRQVKSIPKLTMSEGQCPDCSSPLVIQEGCKTCMNCGWSKCS